jgi:predicted transcriptional regulator
MSSTDRIAVDAYVIDSLMPDLVGHDRRPAAFIVYLYLWRRTRGGARPVVTSLSMLADGTGLSKRSTQTALQHLERRDLVSTRRTNATSAATVVLRAHWRR